MTLAFIHIEKTAGLTVNRILRVSMPFGHCDYIPGRASAKVITRADYKWMRRIYPMLRSIAGHSIVPYSDFGEEPDIDFFTFLRNPVTRCASHYQYQMNIMGKQMPFGEWIKNEKYHNFQVKKLAGSSNADTAIDIISRKRIFVGLTEEFDESLAMLAEHFSAYGLQLSYQSKNVSGDNSIKARVLEDPQSRRLIDEANREDWKLYRFAKETVYPAQLREFAANEKGVHISTDFGFLPRLREATNICYRNIVYKPAVALSLRFGTS